MSNQRGIRSASQQENFLGYFGPLSLIMLLTLWAAGLIFGFTLLQFGAGDHVQLRGQAVSFYGLLYHSGETFFTLGYGDIVPISPGARASACTCSAASTSSCRRSRPPTSTASRSPRSGSTRRRTIWRRL